MIALVCASNTPRVTTLPKPRSW